MTPRLLALGLALAALAGCTTWADTDAKLPYPCSRPEGSNGQNPDDGGTPLCATGWRCGVDNQCHPETDAGQIACRVDGDCSDGWRCDVVAGQCVNAGTEGVVPSAYTGGFDSVTVSPQQMLPVPSVFTASRIAFHQEPNQRYPVRTLAFASDDAGLAVTRYYPEPLKQSDGGERSADLYRLPVSGEQVQELAVIDQNPVVLFRDGGAVVFQFDEDAGSPDAAYGARSLSFPPTRLRVTDTLAFDNGNDQQFLLAPEGDKLHVITTGVDPIVLAPNAGPILDAVGTSGSLWISTRKGLYLSTRIDAGMPPPPPQPSDAGWMPPLPFMGWPGLETAACPTPGNDGGSTFVPLRLHTQPLSGFVAVEAIDRAAPITRDTRGTHIAITQYGPNPSPPGPCLSGQQSRGPCQLCPDGQSVKELTFTTVEERGGLKPEVTVRCPADAGHYPELTFALSLDQSNDGSCAPRLTPIPDPLPRTTELVEQRASGGMSAHGGSEGQAWFTDLENPDSSQPLLLDALPGTLLRLQGGPSTDGMMAVANNRIFELNAGIGFVAHGQPLQPGEDWPAAVVENHLSWAVTGNGWAADIDRFLFGGEQPRWLAEPASGDAPSQPFHALRGSAGDGGTVLVLSANDALYAANVTQQEKDDYTPPATLTVKLVPIPKSPILSFTLVPATQGSNGQTPLLSGYALTASTLFQINAATEDRWESTAVAVDPTAGDFVAVWSEDGRARVGLSTGRVMALPARVPISECVASDCKALRVRDYARLCGDTFALTGDGLYRLVPGGRLGTWQREPHNPAWSRDEFANGRLYRVPGELYVASPSGKVVKFVPASDDPKGACND